MLDAEAWNLMDPDREEQTFRPYSTVHMVDIVIAKLRVHMHVNAGKWGWNYEHLGTWRGWSVSLGIHRTFKKVDVGPLRL